jgi:1-deoxy-D-xylulose-5-phosphate synthase
MGAFFGFEGALSDYPILETLAAPQQIHGFTLGQLRRLAHEVRRFLIDSVSGTGGHFASNMGTVELTVALFHAFDFLLDRVVWDVGHQAYPHKVLSGRWPLFSTLREMDGISGFPKREESPYDHFDTGHSSTSISAALGMAGARDLQGQGFACIAVIGDGSLTAGMAFEALNQTGYMKPKRFMVILNDNDMSINPNVGSLQGYLNHIISGQYYHKWQDRLENAIERFAFGKMRSVIKKFVKRGHEVIKHIAVPGLLFEDLGFRYIGPVNGHSMKSLTNSLAEAKEKMQDGPVLLHVQTKKGHGYAPSESDPLKWHGVGSFDAISGETASVQAGGRTGDQAGSKGPAPPTYTEVFGDALLELAANDDRIVCISAAMLEGTGLNAFQKAHPDRCFDVGIAEQHAVTFAAGLAVQGQRPIVAIYSTFLQRGFDQVFHDVCLQNLPVVFAMDRAGVVGADGATHHGLYDLAYLRCLPNMVLMAPKDENELRHMLYTAIHRGGPTAIRYPRGAAPGAPLDGHFAAVPIGRGELLREGADVALVSLGTMVGPALAAAALLEGAGVSCSVINARFAKPLDVELICAQALKAGRVATVEEGCLPGGFGSAVAECLADASIAAPILRCGVADRPVRHGPTKRLLEAEGLGAEGIAERVGAFAKGNAGARRRA